MGKEEGRRGAWRKSGVTQHHRVECGSGRQPLRTCPMLEALEKNLFEGLSLICQKDAEGTPVLPSRGVPVPEHLPHLSCQTAISSLSQATLHAASRTQVSIAFHCCMSKGFLVPSSNTDCMAFFALETMCWLFCLLLPPSPFSALLCALKVELHT